MAELEPRQYGAPEQGAVVRPLREVVGPEIEVAQVVVHHRREVERAGRDHRLDEERAYRAVHVQDVRANPAKRVLQAAQRDLGALSRTKARLQPVNDDAPVLIWGRGFAPVGEDGVRRLPPLAGRQDRGHERDIRARQGLEVRRWFSSYPNPSRYDPMTCATRRATHPQVPGDLLSRGPSPFRAGRRSRARRSQTRRGERPREVRQSASERGRRSSHLSHSVSFCPVSIWAVEHLAGQ